MEEFWVLINNLILLAWSECNAMEHFVTDLFGIEIQNKKLFSFDSEIIYLNDVFKCE